MTTQRASAPLPPERIPTDYRDGYARARATDPAIADSYVSHTTIGDSGISYAMPNYLGRNARWGDPPPGNNPRNSAEAVSTEQANRME